MIKRYVMSVGTLSGHPDSAKRVVHQMHPKGKWVIFNDIKPRAYVQAAPTRQTILTHRTRLGWTNYRLAKESGVPESTVRRYLAGQIDTTTEKADRMMGAMVAAK